jgi:peptidoglycan/xylan/chitin deacetylase (PgdA/CDA1 family)
MDAPAGLPGVGPSLPYPVKAAVTRVRSAGWLVRTRGRLQPGLRILFYHRVSDDDDLLAVRPKRFREQMAFLADAGFQVVDVPAVAALLEAGPPPSRTIGLSFDDGYRDIAEHALGPLEQHGFKATVYVTTGVADGREHFGWYERQPPVMGWDDIRALDGGAFEFEAHTVSHPNLLTVGDAEAAAEVRDGRAELEARLGRTVTSFCYPAGLFGERERRLVQEAGYRSAASCEPGVNEPGTDRLALRRRQIDSGDDLLDFRAKAGGGHDTPLPLRATYRRLRYGMVGTPARASASS